MKSRPLKIAGVLVGLTMIVVIWTFFAPTKLGGSTSYSITDGISMQPTLYKNDLAVVRVQSSYRVGEVVLYQNQVLHREVLHRIILIQNGDYYFKGDNNNFVDPGYATRAELTGALWFEVPKVGVVLGWFGKPFHAALLAGLAVLGVTISGVSTKKKRRRQRRSSQQRGGRYGRDTNGETMTEEGVEVSASNTPNRAVVPAPPDKAVADGRPARTTTAGTTASPANEARAIHYGPTFTLALTCIVAALSALFLAVGFSRPLNRVVPMANAYRATGTFSYSGAVNAPTPVYPSGFVKTGQPVYSSLVNSIKLRFSFRFTSKLPHNLKGTIELNALVLSQSDTWQQLSTVIAQTPFVGDRASLSGTFPLSSLYALINSVSTQTGIEGEDYSAQLAPSVRITGTVGAKPIDVTFSPVLPVTISQTTLSIDDSVAPVPLGATYAPSTPAQELAAVLHPVQAGTIPVTAPNAISVAKYDIAVPSLRKLGVIFVVLAIMLAVVHDLIRRRMSKRSIEDVIADRRHSLIVPVTALAERGAQVTVPDFTDLASLASFLEQPILFEMNNGQRTYAVDDDAHRYVYRPTSRSDRGVTAAPGAVVSSAAPG